VMRLDGPWDDLIRALPKLGPVMALTRNESCVHEKTGAYDHVDLGAATGVVLNGAIDLRIFLKHWRHGYAVTELSRGRKLDSLQFFDADGTAIHKIYRTDATDYSAWLRLTAQFTAAVQTPLLEPRTVANPLPHLLTDAAVDVQALRDGWRTMRDGPHEFLDLLRRQRVTRLQAARLAGDEFARPVNNDAVRSTLESARDSGMPLMVFVASRGVVQIHAGTVHKVVQTGDWLNVLDADFSLHLRTDHIAESWVVDKPAQDGPVRSLDLYDADGMQIMQVFGLRKPNTPQQPQWHALMDGLETREHVSA
ncbi:MAG TPA: ChuX/HutX family heme-like substrate-binding protein, partial [Oleiagrimonas sp.]|nr:ChuX/HutX family heme-like substrate-binding protein [Oleiagrimonas sp.]